MQEVGPMVAKKEAAIWQPVAVWQCSAVCFTVAVAILAKAQKTSLAIPGVWPSPGS